MTSPYQKARNEGYTDEEILSFWEKKNPAHAEKISLAQQEGHSPEEIVSFLSGKEKGSFTHAMEEFDRHKGRTIARGLETVLGAPRAGVEFLEGLVPEKALIKGAEKIGLGKGAKNLLETAKKYAPYKLLPTSTDIRENVTKYLFGEKLEPKNEWERKADDLVSDFTALALPLPGQKLKLLRPALTALGGNIASDIIGRMGGSHKSQTYAKLGTFLVGSLIHPKEAANLKDQLYSEARAARPTDAVVTAKNLYPKTKNLKNTLKKGGEAQSKSGALKKLDEIERSIKDGNIEVEELESFKRSINESLSGLYDEFKTNKVGRKAAKKNLQDVSKIIDETLREYGKENPQWEAAYRPANEVHGAIESSKKVRRSIVRHAKHLGFPALLAELGLYHAGGTLTAGVTTAAGAAVLGGGEVVARIMRSPTLRKHYSNLINAALKDDVVAMGQNLQKLDSELRKENQSQMSK
jgi:hypothetical protein